MAILLDLPEVAVDAVELSASIGGGGEGSRVSDFTFDLTVVSMSNGSPPNGSGNEVEYVREYELDTAAADGSFLDVSLQLLAAIVVVVDVDVVVS